MLELVACGGIATSDRLERIAAGNLTSNYIEQQNDAPMSNRRCSLIKVDDMCVIVRLLQGRKDSVD